MARKFTTAEALELIFQGDNVDENSDESDQHAMCDCGHDIYHVYSSKLAGQKNDNSPQKNAHGHGPKERAQLMNRIS